MNDSGPPLAGLGQEVRRAALHMPGFRFPERRGLERVRGSGSQRARAGSAPGQPAGTGTPAGTGAGAGARPYPASRARNGSGRRLLARVLYFPCGPRRAPLIPGGIRARGIWPRPWGQELPEPCPSDFSAHGGSALANDAEYLPGPLRLHFPAAPSGCFYAFEFSEMKLRLRVSFFFFFL